MSKLYCPDCGHKHPKNARFCMYCGYLLTDGPPASQGNIYAPEVYRDPNAVPDEPIQERGINWTAIATGFFAYLGLRHATRKARQTAIILVLLLVFFGCPMVCGFLSFFMEWFAGFFG